MTIFEGSPTIEAGAEELQRDPWEICDCAADADCSMHVKAALVLSDGSVEP